MANRYWVGGTGTWNTTSTTNWSAASALSFTASCTATALTTTGSPALVVGMTVYSSTNVSLGTIVSGTGNSWVVSVGGTYASQTMTAATVGASVPTAADSVFFDQATTYTVTMTGALLCLDITVSAGTVTFATGTTPTLAIAGSMSLVAATVWNSTGTITFSATVTGKTITTNGVAISGSITFSGTGGGWTLGSALTLSASATVIFTRGTIALSTFTLTTGFFGSTGITIRSINFGTGNITLIGAGGTLWDTNTASNLTISGTQVVNVSYSGAVATTISTGAFNEANSISFNFTAGTYALTLTAGSKRDLNFTGFAGTVSNTTQTIYGNLNLGSTATFTAGANAWTFASTSTGKTITANGKSLGTTPFVFNGSGGSWIFQDALASGNITHTNGTLDLNGKTITLNGQYATGAGTKNLTFNGGTMVILATGSVVFNNNPTGFTTTAGTGTGTISLTSNLADKTFDGRGSTFNCTLNQGGTGSGSITITGSNTFNNITNTVQPSTILFTAGTTNTFNNFSLSGTAGNLVTIASATAATHTLSKASGTVSVDYLSITNSTATGGATWNGGLNSVNGGGNTGWILPAALNTGAFFSIL